MKNKLLASVVFLAMALSACDDTTDSIGSSLTNSMDNLKILTDTFEVETRSILSDSVLSRSNKGYLGRIKDPETGAYVTADFMVQFNTLEDYQLQDMADIVSRDNNNEIIADSCDIRIFYTSFYGDSLATMKLTALEMGEALQEGRHYYSNFDPESEGLIRQDGLQKDVVYTLTDLSVKDSLRATSSYTPSILVKLDKPYTDKDGKTYNNYGTYLLRKYYEDNRNFRDPYKFIHNICPGFYFKMKGGLGSMATVLTTELNIHYRYYNADNDSIYQTSTAFAGTEEVIQASRITNDKKSMKALLEDNTCTYIKTPAGIFTEMTLPVEKIMQNHQNDTLNSAKIVLTRINNINTSDYHLNQPDYLLILQKDSLYSFFENNKLHDNKTSFLIHRDYVSSSSYSSSTKKYKNTYTIDNIASLIRFMNDAKAKGGSDFETLHPNWNKIVIVPVDVSTHTVNSSSSVQTIYDKLSNDLSLTSSRFVGGLDNNHEKIKVSVIYSKFNQK